MRIAIVTIVVVATVVTACSLPVDEFTAPQDAAVDTEAPPDTFAGSDAGTDTGTDTGSGESEVGDAYVDSDDASDAWEAAPPDSGCMCVKKTGAVCKEWQPPGCGG